MHIEVFNTQILRKYSRIDIGSTISFSEKIFEHDLNVNIVFVKEKDIKKLNMEYRKVNSVTDVLSFLLDGIGEVYICPKYVKRSFKKEAFDEEIIRLIVHGILHLLGYDHKGKFEEGNKEEIFVIQEEKVKEILNYLKEKMYLIVGLGNPGKEYENNRHNTGYIFLDELAGYLASTGYETSSWKAEKIFESEINILKKDNKEVVLLKPLSFMNNSGISVKKALKKYKVEDFSKNLILVHDDLDIPLGQYKIQLGKSPKGHNGVNSVEDHLGNSNFLRVRIGVDNRKDVKIPGEKYVLMNFTEDEKILLNKAIESCIKELVLYLN